MNKVGLEAHKELHEIERTILNLLSVHKMSPKKIAELLQFSEDDIKKLAEKHKVALENYIVQDGDLKTYVTTSVAYKAQFANVDCLHEPWLHLRRCQKLTMKGKDIVDNIIGYVVYVWDTREIVQWIENKGKDTLALNTPKAVDNAQPLKDTKHLVPAWAMQDMKSSKDLWSMANMPEDVQKRYYNR